jgi:hypothetical protein
MLVPKITGTMIRAGRVFAHLSQDQLAARAGIHRDFCALGKVRLTPCSRRNTGRCARAIEAREREGIRSTVDGVRLQRAAPVTSPAKQGSRSMSAALLEKAARCRCWPRVSRPVTWASLFC